MGLVNIKTVERKFADALSIDVDAAKAHCFIVSEDSTQDAYITDLIKTAQAIVEADGAIPFCFFTTTYEATFETDAGRITLPKSPVANVESVEYYSGTEWVEIQPNEYDVELGDNIERVIFKSFSRGNFRRYRITFTAGVDTPDKIRIDIKRAVACLVANLYEYRGSATTQQLYDNAVSKAIIANIKRL